VKKIIFTLLVLSLAAIVQAKPATIQVEFEYNTPAQAFNLYMDGKKVCNTNEPNVMNCTNIEIPFGVHMFTMTAVVDNVETQHSPAYVWTYAPEPIGPPVFINFSISVDGKDVQVVPANQ